MSASVLLRRCAFAATGIVVLVVPSAAQAITVAPAGAACYVDAENERDIEDEAAAYKRATAAQVPILAVSGAVKRRAGETLELRVESLAGAAVLDGTTLLEPDKSGFALRKFLDLNFPDKLLTGGDYRPTAKTEINRLKVTFSLNEVVQDTKTVDFLVGIMGATAPINERNGQRKKSLWKVSGLGPGAYYAFFRKGKRTEYRIKLGTAKGPCGYLTTRQYTKPPKGKGPWDIHIQRSSTFKTTLAELVMTQRGGAGGFSSAGTFEGIQAPI